MGSDMPLEIILAMVSGLFSVLFWLLRNKDEVQAAQIKTLFEKHDSDAQALQELRVQIASRHYEKTELDAKFNALEAATREGFRDLSAKFDRLAEALTKHMQEEDRRK